LAFITWLSTIAFDLASSTVVTGLLRSLLRRRRRRRRGSCTILGLEDGSHC
jgi:hypothetical protein